MDKCRGVLGFLFGHSYRPAITRGAPSANLWEVEGGSSFIISLIDKTKPETFHGIYCKRCGKCGDALPVESCPCDGDSSCWVTRGWHETKLAV